MSKYLSTGLWEPSEGFITTKTEEKIIKENQRNLSILAGPGAGKTELLAQRANYLLQTGKCKTPQKILALSFKVDAATNIKNRVDLRCGNELGHRFDSWTFDAFFISIVRRFSYLLPDWVDMQADFDVYSFDRGWWNDYERLELDGLPCKYRGSFTDPNLHSPLDLSETPNEEIVKIWNYCTVNKVADYPMCRSMAFTIVKNHSQVRNLVLSTYKYLFLDEFQDTTDPQYGFLKVIFKGSDTIITAVGDSNQMIMGWAGANLKNFENLRKDFNSERIHIMVNHRSNSKIVSLINYVIKDLTPSGEEPIIYEGTRQTPPPASCIGVRGFDSVKSEADYISKYINLLMRKTPSMLPSNFVLILRQKAQDYFNQANETFQNNSLNLRNEDALVVKNGVKIQDLMSEPLSIFFILLVRYKIGFINYTQKNKLESIASTLTGYDLNQDRSSNKLKKYITSLVSCIDLSKPIRNSVIEIVKTIGKMKMKAVFPQYRSKHLNKVGKSICLLFQHEIDKNPTDIKKAIENYEGANQVKLMTIHKSKSLEFDTVFFVDFHHDSWWGLCKAIRQNNDKKQREEKNSFFVGLSRAEERLFFTKSKGNWPPIIIDLLKKSKLIVKMPDVE